MANKPETTETTEKPERHVRISAKYLLALAPLMAKDDVRYYLNGIHVEPHPDGGVVLVATNGHVGGIIHDAEGDTNGRWICPISKRLLAACKTRVRDPDERAGNAWFIGDTASITNELVDAWDVAATVGPCHLHIEHAPAIVGTFPDWRKIVPGDVTPCERLTANLSYIGLFKSALDLAPSARKYEGVTIYQAGTTNDAYLVRVDDVPEFLGIIMPMRAEIHAALPDWIAPYRVTKAAGEKERHKVAA